MQNQITASAGSAQQGLKDGNKLAALKMLLEGGEKQPYPAQAAGPDPSEPTTEEAGGSPATPGKQGPICIPAFHLVTMSDGAN